MAAPAPDNSIHADANGEFRLWPLLYVAVLVLPAAGLMCLSNASWLDTLNCAGLCVAILVGLLVTRGGARLAGSSAGRLWTITSFIFAALILSPAFQRGVPIQLDAGGRTWIALSLFALAALLLFLITPRHKVESTPATALESFLYSARARFHLFAFAAILLFPAAQLSGQPFTTVLFDIGLVALALLILRPLLAISAYPRGARWLNATAAVTLGVSSVFGVMRYRQTFEKADTLHALLAENKVAEAQTIAGSIEEANTILKSNELNIRLETEWAEYLERAGDLWGSFSHWQRVADYKSIPRAEFAPALRVTWKAGDSMSVWRRLVYKGFAAMREADVAQGVLDLGDRPGSDLRARLAAALLACELQQPAEDCKRRLQTVQALQPNELSSNMLLENYGVKLPNAALVLPPDLLVGHEPTFHAVTGKTDAGTIEEQGEASSIVVLGQGHYEMLIPARATPLREEWPIIRVELNGHEIGRTQVVSSDERLVPFTFDVNRTDAYKLRIVFENYIDADLFDDEKPDKFGRRGLTIGTITFRRQKN